jgi:hypothetical protein
MKSVDLHTHTNYSDGSMSPEALLDLAVEKNLVAIAITDHDDIGAAAPAAIYAEKNGLEFIPGVELSINADLPGRGHLHILGYMIDTQSEEIHERLDWLKAARMTRAVAILGKLRDLGVDISLTELEKSVGEGSAGRPHIAQMLVDKKIVPDIWQAFSVYLSKGRPAYVPKQKLDLKPAIDLIHAAGGIAVLAHPVSLFYTTYHQYETHLQEMVDLGLDGLEVYYYSHDRYFREFLQKFCEKRSLVVTGGSDFHGEKKPEIELGTATGELNVPYAVVEGLKAYHADSQRG